MYATGRFIAAVEAAMLTKSTNKGTEQVAIVFRLLEGPNSGQQITAYLALTEARLPYTVKELRVCGFQGDDLTKLDGMKGQEVSLVLDEDTYNGKTRTKVAFINPVREIRQAEDAAGIAARWKAKIAALPKEAEQPDPFGA